MVKPLGDEQYDLTPVEPWLKGLTIVDVVDFRDGDGRRWRQLTLSDGSLVQVVLSHPWLILRAAAMSARGGLRDNAGRKSAYPGKVDAPCAMDFTPAGRKVLDGLTHRTGLSRNDVLSHLIIQHADALAFDAEGVAFPGKAQLVLSVRVPREAWHKLIAARARTGKSYSDLGEALVRRHGHGAAYPIRPESDKRPARGRRRRRT